MRPYGLDVQSLAIFCLIWGMGASFMSLLISKWIAKFMYGVQVIDPNSANGAAHNLYVMVERAAQSAGLPRVPEVGIYDSAELNAFATGPSRGNALVAVSTGLLNSMSESEIEGVIGHEITHVANGDMVTMTLLQGVVNAIVMFVSRIVAYGAAQAVRGDRERGSNPFVYTIVLILTQLVLGFAGIIVVSWFSRRREFRADAGSAHIFGREKMIGALRALENRSRYFDPRGAQMASFKISTRPVGGLMTLFATHPSIEERIAALSTQV